MNPPILGLWEQYVVLTCTKIVYFSQNPQYFFRWATSLANVGVMGSLPWKSNKDLQAVILESKLPLSPNWFGVKVKSSKVFFPTRGRTKSVGPPWIDVEHVLACSPDPLCRKGDEAEHETLHAGGCLHAEEALAPLGTSGAVRQACCRVEVVGVARRLSRVADVLRGKLADAAKHRVYTWYAGMRTLNEVVLQELIL